MKIIINADDFGFSKGVNLGIVEAFKNGVVRSATIMPNMPFFDHAAELYKQYPGLNVGVQITITMGEPIIKGHKTLVDSTGKFKGQGAFFSSVYRMDLEEIMDEMVAQIDKAIAAGIKVTHIDSYQHVHELEIFEYLMMELSQRYNLPIRGINDRHINRFKKYGIRTCDDFSAEFFGEMATEDTLIEIVNRTKQKSIEIMCHPGYVDYELHIASNYVIKRIEEMRILTSDRIKDFFNSSRYELCGYNDL